MEELLPAFPRHPGGTRRGARWALAAGTAVARALTGCSSLNSTECSIGLSGKIVWVDFGGPTNKARESYDAIHVGLDLVYQNKDHIAPLDPGVGRDANLPENIRDYAFGTFYVGHVQAYLTATFPGGGPKTWADFFDVKKYPGKRGWMGSPGSPGSYDSACEIAELASGIAPDKLYPLNFDLCTGKLDELRPDMVFYTSYPQIQLLLTSKTAAVVAGPSGQAFSLRNQGVDVTNEFNDPQRQATFAELTGYGPGNPDAFTYMDDATKANIVNSPDHAQIVYQDSEERAKQDTDLLNWYTKWLAG